MQTFLQNQPAPKAPNKNYFLAFGVALLRSVRSLLALLDRMLVACLLALRLIDFSFRSKILFVVYLLLFVFCGMVVVEYSFSLWLFVTDL